MPDWGPLRHFFINNCLAPQQGLWRSPFSKLLETPTIRKVFTLKILMSGDFSFLLTMKNALGQMLPQTSALQSRRLYSYLLVGETAYWKTHHFQWIYGKLSQIYEKLRSDQMDPKSALGGPIPISRTGDSLLKNWSYTSNPCIYFSILLDWRAHLARTLFIPHKYIKCALL